MENREQQNRNLQPIHDSDRQGERNPSVFLKAKVIQASSLLNSDRDETGLSLPDANFDEANFTQK